MNSLTPSIPGPGMDRISYCANILILCSDGNRISGYIFGLNFQCFFYILKSLQRQLCYIDFDNLIVLLWFMISNLLSKRIIGQNIRPNTRFDIRMDAGYILAEFPEEYFISGRILSVKILLTNNFCHLDIKNTSSLMIYEKNNRTYKFVMCILIWVAKSST